MEWSLLPISGELISLLSEESPSSSLTPATAGDQVVSVG